MLQPVAAYPFTAVTMIMLQVKKEAERKELELLGQSSVRRVAGDAFQRGEQATWRHLTSSATASLKGRLINSVGHHFMAITLYWMPCSYPCFSECDM